MPFNHRRFMATAAALSHAVPSGLWHKTCMDWFWLLGGYRHFAAMARLMGCSFTRHRRICTFFTVCDAAPRVVLTLSGPTS